MEILNPHANQPDKEKIQHCLEHHLPQCLYFAQDLIVQDPDLIVVRGQDLMARDQDQDQVLIIQDQDLSHIHTPIIVIQALTQDPNHKDP